MSWVKMDLSKSEALALFRRNIPDRPDDERSLWTLELCFWLEEWCKANSKDRVKIRAKYGPIISPTGWNRGGKFQELKHLYIKFKNSDDAMLFRLTL